MLRPPLRILLGTWLVLLAGCAASRQDLAPADDVPFFCATAAPPPEEPRPVPIVNLPTGRLEIVCQPEAPLDPQAPRETAEPKPPTLKERLLARRCRFLVQAVPLVDVAIALSAATGYDFVVQSEIMPLRVGVSLHEATIQEFVESLRAAEGRARLSVDERQAQFYWQQGLADHYPCGPEIGVVLVRIPPGVPRRQLASIACHQILSQAGSVSLIGDMLIAQGYRTSLEKLQTLIRTLDPTKGPAKDPAKSSPPPAPGCPMPSE